MMRFNLLGKMRCYLMLVLCGSTMCFAFSNFGRRHQRPGTTLGLWPGEEPPYLALITEPDACDSPDRIESTLTAIEAALSTKMVTLVSIRISKNSNDDNDDDDDDDDGDKESCVKELTNRIVELTKDNPCRIVVSSDWADTVQPSSSSDAVGVHVKESHRDTIPAIRQRLGHPNVLIGTSAHSVESALDAVAKYQPDYLFVGTCYLTKSHPEKDGTDLEGPALPGLVKRALDQSATITTTPIIFAIGGIDATNCDEPVVWYGADGVAVIRAILQASDPAKATFSIQSAMSGSTTKMKDEKK